MFLSLQILYLQCVIKLYQTLPIIKTLSENKPQVLLNIILIPTQVKVLNNL